MKRPEYINPTLQQMGTKPRLRKRFKNAIAPPRMLLSHETVPASRSLKCPNSSSWFDFNKRHTQEQRQASLFKLPLEIRLLIYKEVIDAWTRRPVEGYHIVETRALDIIQGCHKTLGLTFIPCDCPSSGTSSEDSEPGRWSSSSMNHEFPQASAFHWWTRHRSDHVHSSFDCRGSGRRLSIFLSCRRM